MNNIKLFKTPRFLYWIFPRRTWGFSRKKNSVYLTFDDGPQPEITEWVLDFLKEKNIKATFFCVGNNLLKYPKITERTKLEGHLVANHTMHHNKGTKTSFKKYKESIDETSKLVSNNLFRPPYGRITALDSFRINKEYKIIMWTWLSYDFDRNVSIEKILDKAKKQIKAGDIIVLHDNIKTFDRLKLLLPGIVKIIQDKKLTFEVINS